MLEYNIILYGNNMILHPKHYETSKEKFLYGYFIVFLVGASIGFVIRLLIEQYIIAVLDIVAISIVLWVVYDYETRHDIDFSSLVLFWMISLFMFYYIYHLGYDNTIFQLLPIPLSAAMILNTQTYKKHMFVFLLLFFLLMAYGFYHKENYPTLQDTTFVAQASIIIMFAFAAGFVYHYSINKYNEKLLETNTRLLQANEEKTYLLQEIHHRVKNNLNMMTSILGLQEASAKTDTMRIFIEQNILRIKSIALVHELLYQEKNFTSIPLDTYVNNLVRHIISLSKHQSITLTKKIEDIKLNTDDIIHIGIIINELMTNSLKYAFEQKIDDGTIEIEIKRIDNHYLLHYSDNGTGMDDVKLEDTGFGLRLIGLSVEHLNGVVKSYTREGLHTEIVFKGTQT